MTEVKGQCPAHGADTSGHDSYSWNETKGVGQCFSCGLHTWLDEKGNLWGRYGKHTKPFPISTMEDYKEFYDNGDEVVETKSNEHGSYVSMRGITKETMEFFGVKTYEDRQEYVYPSGGIKVRKLPKEFFAKNGFKGNELFGMNLFPAGSSKMVTCVEGELDTLSAYQMLQNGSFVNPVVSLPSASPSGKLWENCKGWLDSFEKIILSLDNDEPGQRVAEKMSLMFPGKVFVMDHGQFKDANDFLQAGKAREYKSAWWGAKRYKPSDVLISTDDYIKLYDEAPDFEYFTTGIEELDSKILGINKGYFTVIQAPTGVGKCLGPDQGVMLWDGSIKKAKDVSVGDTLMGDDSGPRHVLSVTSGKQEMFKVIPNKGKPWVCNRSHILSVVNTTTGVKFDISVDDYLKQNATFKHEHKLYRVPVESFGYFQDQYERYNPYLIGAYLGDGHKDRPALSLGPKKKAVMDWVVKCLEVTGNQTKLEDKGSYTELTFKGGEFYNYIKQFFDDKRIPDEYKYSGWNQRLILLAGILDTDGCVASSGVEITQKSKTLADDIAFVARSVGLAAYVKEKVGMIKSSGFSGKYWRVNIYGDMSEVPFKRLKVKPRKINKDPLRTGFTLESLGEGEYCGFEIDGNKRFLLDDFTVTHNTEVMRYLEYQCLIKSDYKFAYMHLEESRQRSVLGLVSYHLKQNLTLKKFVEESGCEEEVKQAISELYGTERALLFDFNPEDGYEELINRIKYFVAAFDIDYVFLEPLQDLVTGNVTEKESQLSDLASRFGILASQLNVGIVVIAHQNSNGDTMYSSMIGKKAAFEILLYRDQQAEDPMERNRVHVVVGRKNRVGLGSGPSGALDFDLESYTLKPVEPPKAPVVNREDF